MVYNRCIETFHYLAHLLGPQLLEEPEGGRIGGLQAPQLLEAEK